MSMEQLKTVYLKKVVNGVHNTYMSEQEDHELELLKQTQKKHWWGKDKQGSILTQEEQKILKRVKSRAYFLDRGVTCCCLQIGFDAFIGLIPVVGDLIGLLCALHLIHMAMKADIPQELVTKMIINVVFDFLLGLLPIIGDLMDIMYKCNTKNAIIFENYLLKRRLKLMNEGTDHTAIQHIPV
ncbi:hypothetical protein BDB01DRAFT_801122 [Pilobolus umbonatus]|nr:hypothetical protein BDB01DRAFT_801122 [Pilobolus umbonatus]